MGKPAGTEPTDLMEDELTEASSGDSPDLGMVGPYRVRLSQSERASLYHCLELSRALDTI